MEKIFLKCENINIFIGYLTFLYFLLVSYFKERQLEKVIKKKRSIGFGEGASKRPHFQEQHSMIEKRPFFFEAK